MKEEPPEKKKGPKMVPPDKGGFPGKKPPPFGKTPPEKEIPEGQLLDVDAPRELQERFQGNYNVFDPLGGYRVTPVEEVKKDPKKKKDFKGKQKPPIPLPIKENAGKEEDKKLEGLPVTAEAARLLLRFIDVDVEPGKTYRYWFRVRLANPNYGSKDVAALDLSKSKELEPGELAYTKPITIPKESFIYAVDQADIGEKVNGRPPLVATRQIPDGIDYPAGQNLAEMTPVQIHRWMKEFQERDRGHRRTIGDWVIAERLLIKRGDLVGRGKVVIEIPEWYKTKNRFDLGILPGGKANLKGFKGTPVDFLADETKVPLLVDFYGGRHGNYTLGAGKKGPPDNAAVATRAWTPTRPTRSAGSGNSIITSGATGSRKCALLPKPAAAAPSPHSREGKRGPTNSPVFAGPEASLVYV